MHLLRMQDLSVYYWLKSVFSSVSYINVVDEFPQELLTVPTVSLDVNFIDTDYSELGNKHRVKIRTWYIDIFAKTKVQRNELGYKLLDELENSIPVYNYDEGFPPDISPTQVGCLIPDDISMEVVKVMPELVDKMYYRATVAFTARYSLI